MKTRESFCLFSSTTSQISWDSSSGLEFLENLANIVGLEFRDVETLPNIVGLEFRGVLRLYYKSRLSTFQPRKLRVSAAYYVCSAKVDFQSGSPRRATSVPHKSKKRKTLRFSHRNHAKTRRGVTFARNAKTRRFWHRANAETRRGVTFVCYKTQKHDGFGTAPTPKPAEGCLRPRKKVPKTTVFAPRPGDYPQRVVRGPKEK